MKRILFYLSLIAMLFIFIGCSKIPELYVLNEKENNLFIGESFELDYVVKTGKNIIDEDVNIKSSNDDSINIINDTVEALDVGEAVITISLKSHPEITATIKVTVTNPLTIVTDGGYSVNLGKSLNLTVNNKLDNDEDYHWTLSDINIANIRRGVFTPFKEGEVIITATGKKSNISTSVKIIITDKDVDKMEIISPVDTLEIGDTLQLAVEVFPEDANNEVMWSSSDRLVAEIDEFGLLTVISNGDVTITAASKRTNQTTASISFTIPEDPIKLLTSLHVDRVIAQVVTTYGYNPDERRQIVYGSVNMFFNSSLNLVENIIPVDESEYTGKTATKEMLEIAEEMKLVRSGILHPETKYITYHDTGNHTPGARAHNHGVYMVGSDNRSKRARSWHYTVDDEIVIQHIPDNEVTWQGDTFDAYAYSIGVETCVDFGSDLYTTWQRTAKLMALLIKKHNLSIKDIKPHNYFSGKECPQTLRRNNLYNHAIDLIVAEYLVLTKLADYTITFTSLNENIVDNRGRVISFPDEDTIVQYKITISNDEGYKKSVTLESLIPAKPSL